MKKKEDKKDIGLNKEKEQILMAADNIIVIRDHQKPD